LGRGIARAPHRFYFVGDYNMVSYKSLNQEIGTISARIAISSILN
jgi:hypothetical protein